MEFFNKASYMYIFDTLKNTTNISIPIVVVTILLAILTYYLSKDYGVPPGPTGVPILGYWPFINSENCHLQMLKLKKKYGDIFSFRVTGKLYINLASAKALREAHITKSDYFSERTSDFNLMGKLFENGVVYSKGDKWLTVRKFFLDQFKERGLSMYKENTAEAMYDNLNTLIEELKKNSNKLIDLHSVLIDKMNNVIRQTLFGVNTSVSEYEISKFQTEYRSVMSLVHSSNMVLIGNIARYFVLPLLPNFKKGLKLHSNLKQFIRGLIEEHKKTYDEENERDIVDAFIKEKQIRKSKGDPTADHFTDETLVSSLFQFVGDAVVNGSTFISSILKALLDHPEEQEKIYKELLEVCGDRNPGFEDKNKLTYTNAFLLEAQRTDNFIPLFPSLECTTETTLGEYRIPKGAVTVTNPYSIHNDPLVYENPEKFDPSRFLAKEGKPKAESPITFGVGKRVCLGEGFVLMQTFLFCAVIVKNFKISYSNPKSYYELIRSRTLDINIVPR